MRSHCKSLIDAVGQRGGQALASLAILGAMFVGARPIHLAAAVAVVGIAWIVAVLGIKKLYLELFRSHLRYGAIETRIDDPRRRDARHASTSRTPLHVSITQSPSRFCSTRSRMNRMVSYASR